MNSHFPKDFDHSRTRFLELCEKISGPKVSGTWKIPSKIDSDLSTDYSYFPALDKNPKNLFMIVSGVHGAESYTGSAIQSLIIQELWSELDRSSTGVLLVHAMNPYGFKYHQRCTEKLVNINRNCSSREDLYKIENPVSLALAKKFIPPVPVESLKAPLLSSLNKKNDKVYFHETSMDDFIKGVGPGQYQAAGALEFGGFEPEPQVKAWTELMKSLTPKYQDIFLFDIHTGLGDRGRLHLLTGDPKLCINPELFTEILSPKEDHKIYDFTSNETEGFYETFGATNDLVAELVAPHQRVCALTLEFGTLGHSFEDQIDSLNRWLLEHQASIYGCKTEEIKSEIKKLNLEKFFPSDLTWRNQILKTSKDFFSLVISRLKKNK